MKNDLSNHTKAENQTKEPTNNRRKINIPILLAIVITVVLAIGVVYYFLFDSNSSLNSNRNFIFTTVKDRKFHIKTSKNRIEIEELKGKIIFLKVFGWDCQYCQQEIPELIKLKDKFVNAFDTIAIEAQHYSNEYNLERINRYNINYSIVEGDRQKSFLQYLKDEYKWDGVIPLTIVINSTGRVLAFEVGYKSYSLTTLLQTTLKQLTRVVSSSK